MFLRKAPSWMVDKLLMSTSLYQVFTDASKGFKPLSANLTKWSNTIKQFADEIERFDDDLFECVSPFCEVGT